MIYTQLFFHNYKITSCYKANSTDFSENIFPFHGIFPSQQFIIVFDSINCHVCTHMSRLILLLPSKWIYWNALSVKLFLSTINKLWLGTEIHQKKKECLFSLNTHIGWNQIIAWKCKCMEFSRVRPMRERCQRNFGKKIKLQNCI